jgi:ABC-2 type transport system permease protein
MSGMRRSLTIARNDFELLSKEPLSAILLILMPLVIMVVAKPTYAAVLHQEGYHFANGAEQAVPGMAVMFAFFMVTFGSLAFFREYMWHTWSRIRAMPVRNREIMLGKAVPSLVIVCCQQLVLFVVGHLLFGLRVRGSVPALVAVDFAFALWLTAFILLVVAVCRTFEQILAISNLGAIVFAGIGGALTPIHTIPSWVSPVAHVTPTYWAMRGFNSVLLDGKGIGAVVVPVAVLLAAAVVFCVAAVARFRFDVAKGGALPGL